jgi:hypothetical protein
MELDLYMYIYLSMQGAIVVVIAYQLDLQLPMQSVPITTKVVVTELLLTFRLNEIC